MGVPRVEDYLDFMPETVTLDPYVSTDVSGQTHFAGDTDINARVVYPARIEIKNHIAVDREGRQIVARGKVFVGTTIVPSVKDKIILPNNYTPNIPPIISVIPQNDEEGVHHITIIIG
jgi:hypothetical protein